MGCCCTKSSAPVKEDESAVETVPRVSFPVVVTNPVSTSTVPSPSTCSTVSTSSGEGSEYECSEEECRCEDESKAREVLRRVVLRWATLKAGQGGDGPKVARKGTPLPALRTPTSSGNDGSDSDPWDVVHGGDL